MALLIRSVRPNDAAAWANMRAALWPDACVDELRREADAYVLGEKPPTVHEVFVADDGGPAGFLELAVRPFANGCDSTPVPFVEGWYVEPKARGRGIGRALMLAAEAWARERGFVELGSDATLANTGSKRAHERCGFIETERVVYFRKRFSSTP